MNDPDPRALLARIFLRIAARVDGQRLVAAQAGDDPALVAATHVLAVGKAALPMLRGLPPGADVGAGGRRILAVVPGPALADEGARGALPAGTRVIAGDHPHPTARSVAAAAEALRFVGTVGGSTTNTPTPTPTVDVAAAGQPRLLVLLSGGASSLLCAPADGLGWEDKRDAVAAVARAGASIRELNAVRKHLSAIKGGQLALAASGAASIAVRALSDVIGGDPATIGSGPFSPDPSTFAEACAIVGRLGVNLPAAAGDRLQRGARGELAETPKPGSGRHTHVDYRVLAGPERVVTEAEAAVAAEGVAAGALPRDTEAEVEELAEAILVLARREAANPGAPRILIGNGEPRVVLPGGGGGSIGRGGRATHLALCVARGLAALPGAAAARVAFLAAGTDDRDGNGDVSGAIVDGTTWSRAQARGLDPDRALRSFDSLPLLAALGDTVTGPGTSNLLDVHLLAVS